MRKTTKRILVLTPLVLLALLIGAGFWVWHMMSAPLYRPGMVRAAENLRGPLQPPTQPGEPGVWRVESDIDLHHFSHGTGTPLLFIHGGPGFPARELPAGLARLTGEYEIHFYDQRGCGDSTRPFDRFASSNFYQNMLTLDKGLGIGAHIADIERIRRILGRDKLIIVGHSFGGFLASLYAAEFPEHVAGLVLLAPADLVVFPQEHGGLFEEIRGLLPAERLDEYDRFVEEYLDFSSVFTKSEAELAARNSKFAEFFRLATGADAAAATQPSDQAAGGWMVTAVYLSLGLQHDYSAALRGVTAPVLLVHGDADLVPVSVSQGYAELFPNARVSVIEGAGHMTFDDRPDEFADVVGEFLRTLAD